MSNIQDIQPSLSKTLKNSDLRGIAKDGTEIAIDGIIKDGLLKDIPIVNALAAIIKTGGAIKDYLFMKKVLSFFSEITDICPKEREKMIDQIDGDESYRLKVGEKLLYILDTCEDSEKSENTAILFKAWLQKKISYDEWIKGSSIINRITTSDLSYFVNTEEPSIDDSELIGIGLAYLDITPVEFIDNEKREIDIPNEVSGATPTVELTNIGKMIKKIFYSKYYKFRHKPLF